MVRWKKYLIATALCVTLIAAAGIWILEIRPHLIKERIKAEVQSEKNLLKEKLQIEADRMTSLAASAHPKCPTKIFLAAEGIPYGLREKIPAYPHLSDIYLYVVPPLKQYGSGRIRNQDKTGNALGYKYTPMTLSDIERTKTRPDLKFKTTPSELLDAVQKENLTPVILNVLQETLAYCTADANGIPKKVKLIDTPHHENLEQEDALTIIVGAISYYDIQGFCYPPLYVPMIGLHTSQYVPRWNVFPSQILTANSSHKDIRGFLQHADDPYDFANISAGNRLSLSPAMDIQQDSYLWFSGKRKTYISVRYKPIGKIYK